MLADGSALNFGHVKDGGNGTYACTFVPLVGGRSILKVLWQAHSATARVATAEAERRRQCARAKIRCRFGWHC